MFVLYAFFASLIFMGLSYFLLKIYQMSGYKLGLFLNNIVNFNIKADDKNKVVFTKRIIRFCLVCFLIFMLVFCLIFFFVKPFWLIFLDCLIVALFTPFIFCLSHFLILPVENLIKKRLILKATRFLHEFKGVKIAIVGSFGKTSIKNILFDILKTKFKVVKTPENYNTPMGICKTLKLVEDDTEILILEMGARQKGDIKELVEIVKPNLAIVSSVGEMHIETFGDFETLKSTKFEIVKHIDKNAVLFFNGKSKTTLEMFKKCDVKKVLTNQNDSDYFAKNLKINKEGMKFELVEKGKVCNIKSCLLGELNAQNIVICFAVCRYLGMTSEKISNAISCLSPIKNRLELIKKGSFTIIDDTYNANFEGAVEALKTLSLFNGKRLVITCGIVELGSIQYEKNFQLGKEISKVADRVLIMNKVNKKALLNGLKAGGFSENEINFASLRSEQKVWLKNNIKKNCVVLFQNDLPDSFK